MPTAVVGFGISWRPWNPRLSPSDSSDSPAASATGSRPRLAGSSCGLLARSLLGLGLGSGLPGVSSTSASSWADALGVDRARAPRPRPSPGRPRCPSGARRRGRACRLGRAGSRALPGARRRGQRPRARSIFGEWSGNVRSTPTPNDCLRTVKVSRAPLPWRAMTMPSKTWVRSARALDHLEVHAHPVPRRKARNLLQLTLLDALDDRAHDEEKARTGWAARAASDSRQLAAKHCAKTVCEPASRLRSRRHSRIRAWSPDSRISGTSQPR